MNADRDGKRVFLCFCAQAEQEGGFVGGEAEGEGFGRRRANVVGCFREEEGLGSGLDGCWCWELIRKECVYVRCGQERGGELSPSITMLE